MSFALSASVAPGAMRVLPLASSVGSGFKIKSY
jgi:hypothetical protein